METLEGNKLIAEFMGYTEDSNGNWKPESGPYFKDYKLKEFTYHNDWGQLMPVVEKIGRIYDSIHLAEQELCRLGIFSPIEKVYQLVIQFITWYNSQSKTPTP